MKKLSRYYKTPSQEALFKAYDWYELVSKATYDAIWDWDFTTNKIGWNDAIVNSYGYTLKELGTNSAWWEEHIHPEDRVRVVRQINYIINSTEDKWEEQYRFLRKDGTYAFIMDRGLVVRDESGKPLRMIGAMQDISKQKAAEAQIKQAEQDFRNLAESIPQLVWVAGPDGYHEYYNQHWYDYTGTTFEDTKGKGWSNMFHPDDRDEAWKKWQYSLKTGKPYEIEYRLLHADSGEYRWFLGRALPIRNVDGKIEKWFGTCTNIHEQKTSIQAQQFLAEASKLLSSSLEYQTTLQSVAKLAVPEIADWCSIDFLSKDGKTLDLVAVAHKDPKKVKWAHTLRKEFPTDLSAPQGVPQVLRSGKSEFYPVITEEMIAAATTDKKIRKLIQQIGFSSVMIVPITVESKTIGVIQFVATESKRHFTKQDLVMAEELAARASLAIHNAKLYEKAQRMEKQFQALQDANIIGVMRATIDGELLYSNDAFLNILGITRIDLKKKTINLRKLTPKQYRLNLKEKAAILEKHGSLQPFEKEYIKKDGSQIPVILGSVMMDPEKQEVLSFVLDITERKKLEQRKDEFIGIASHELRTPLTSVKGYVQILERIIQQMGDERLNNYVRKTNTYIDRLNSLISELLDVSKIQSGKLLLNFSNFDFDTLMRESIEAVQYTVQSHKIISTGKTNATIRGDKHRLEQVITNLLTNAIKYSPRADKIIVHSTIKDNEIIVSVQDFGIGIAKIEIPKVFQRFYRTESVAKTFSGLGIGLFISSEILVRHNGTIWVESQEKKGSTFYFSLPVAKKKQKK